MFSMSAQFSPSGLCVRPQEMNCEARHGEAAQSLPGLSGTPGSAPVPKEAVVLQLTSLAFYSKHLGLRCPLTWAGLAAEQEARPLQQSDESGSGMDGEDRHAGWGLPLKQGGSHGTTEPGSGGEGC